MRFLPVFFTVLAVMTASDHPNLSGSWTYEPSRSQGDDVKSGTLTIEQTDSDVLLREAYLLGSGKNGTQEFRCNTMGKECTFKIENEPVKVSLWFGGPRLVVMEVRGKNGDIVRKRQLGLASDGTLTVEISHISPPGGKQTQVFTKK